MRLSGSAQTLREQRYGSHLPTFSTIVAIARDSALLRSLSFALEAHGYTVRAFSSWRSARGNVDAAGCVILDGALPLSEKNACLGVLERGLRVVLLAEDEAAVPRRLGLQVLPKPLSGADLLSAVASIRIDP